MPPVQTVPPLTDYEKIDLQWKEAIAQLGVLLLEDMQRRHDADPTRNPFILKHEKIQSDLWAVITKIASVLP